MFENFLKLSPTVKASTCEEYFSLPKSQRERYGLYIVPFAMKWNNYPAEPSEWSKWETEIRKHYPVQGFIREVVWDAIDTWLMRCRLTWLSISSSVQNFIRPAHPRFRKVYPRHKFMDLTDGFVRINHALILDFYYEEALSGIVDWDSEDSHWTFYKQLEGYVKAIEVTLPDLDQQMHRELSRGANPENHTKSYNERYGRFNELEKQRFDLQTEIIVWAINNRGYFWT